MKHHKVVQNVNTSDDFTDIEAAFFDKDEVIRIVRVLPPFDQKLIYLRFWKDFSYAEIAERLFMKKSNVHKRIQKILQEIRKKFEESVDDAE